MSIAQDVKLDDDDPRTPDEREQDAAAADWAAQVSDLRGSM